MPYRIDTSYRIGLLVALLLLLAAGPALAQPPTVNGRFYGDGDNARYQPYATSVGGSVLYSYLDLATSRLYVALVVSHQVNDLVCAQKGSGNAYLQSGNAGDPIRWTSHRDCKRASDSEYATFTLECAPGSPRAWTWRQALGCPLVAGPPQRNWVSAPTCPSSVGVWPPSIIASTSWVANVNAFQTNPMPAWNMYVNGIDIADWKTPFLTAFPNDVTQVPGYPTWSPAHQWEWSMFYEWSVNLGPGGANCGNQAIFFVTGESHHSPPKSGPENDVFPPPADPPIISDWGDLPNSYGTLQANNGPRHHLKVSGPFLGAQVQMEGNGVPTADASGDGPEEDGVTMNVTSNWDPGTNQTITVVVGNAPAGAVLAAWFDWNGDGVFTAGEYVTWPVVQGTNNLPITVGAGFDWMSDSLAARFRLFSSGATAPGGSLDAGDFVGTATDGEVEDYIFSAGSLPVTLNAFASEPAAGGGLTVRWQTASETENVGFEILGRVGREWRPLGEFVPSKGMNSALPQSYEVEVSLPQGVTALELVDYDTRGRPERFGPFLAGARYGEFQPVRRIDWSEPRARRQARLETRGFVETEGAAAAPRWRKLEKAKPGQSFRGRSRGSEGAAFEVAGGKTIRMETGPLTHVAVTDSGIQRVSYEALRDGGLDLAGVRAGDIAVTWRGEPVARWVDAQGVFGPGGAIEFIGRPPEGDDALYVESNLYQVSVDPARAREALTLGRGSARRISGSYERESMVEREIAYNRHSPTGDPWIERAVLVRRPSTVTLEIPVDGPVLPGRSRLVLGLGTVTDLPDLRDASGRIIPEHNVEVWFSGPGSDFVYVTKASTSGQQDWKIEADLPLGVLQSGINRVQLRFSTEYLFSFVLIDRYGVRYRAPYLGPRLDFGSDWGADGYRVEGLASPAVAAYAEQAGGVLYRVEPRVIPWGAGYAAELRQVDRARFWVDSSPHRPAVFTTEKPADLLADSADLLVIAESSFIGTAALDDYVAQRAAFRPVVIDVEDIYNGVGFGMALPGAITDFLKVRDEVRPFTQVQLVGADCFDRLNRISACVSFIPLPSAPVGFTRFTPTHNRLVDLDGDGIGDKAVAQFSVRDESELATIIQKAVDWDDSGLSAAESALLIAEESDGLHSFVSQIEGLRQSIAWDSSEVLDLADHPDIATARAALRAALDAGRTVTMFSGHSSPTVWAFRSLLTAASAKTLTNFGLPTLILPLACETTYDISPDADVLGHQLLFAGEQGALAISGAVALSSISDNGKMAGHIIDGLKSGLTLGEAVQAGRDALGTRYQTLQDNWMTQGDVTVKIAPR